MRRVGALSIMDLDEKGRLTLPKDVREAMKIGKKVLVINVGDHLKVIPLPSEPFAVLNGALSVRRSFRELRKRAEEEALSKVGR